RAPRRNSRSYQLRQIPCRVLPAKRRSRDPLGLAQALDQRRAQEEGGAELGVLRGAAQLVVVLAAHGRVLFRQQALVADGLRLGVLQGDVPALALVAVEHVRIGLAAEDADELLRQVERIM